MPAEDRQSLPVRNAFGDALRSDQFDRDAELTELYQTRIEPLIKRIISGKLRVSLRHSDDRQANQDALELMSEVKLLILTKLRQITSGDDRVRDVEAYVRTVTANAFSQYLRRKYPRRTSLRNQFRYLFTHQARFSIWQNDDNQWVCGLAGARSKTPGERFQLSDELRSSIASKIATRSQIGRDAIDFANAIFELCPQPILLDDLVAAACDILQIEEPVEVAEPENFSERMSSSGRVSALGAIEDKEFVRMLWDQIRILPLRHRAALLLNFRDDTGESLITLFPVKRVASIRQIADTLGFEDDDFARIWNELPWEDNRIAEHLGLARQQVINLRQSAKNMLRRKLRPNG